MPVQAKKGQKGKLCAVAKSKSFSKSKVIGPVGRSTNLGYLESTRQRSKAAKPRYDLHVCITTSLSCFKSKGSFSAEARWNEYHPCRVEGSHPIRRATRADSRWWHESCQPHCSSSDTHSNQLAHSSAAKGWESSELAAANLTTKKFRWLKQFGSTLARCCSACMFWEESQKMPW